MSNRLFEVPYNFDFNLVDMFAYFDTSPSTCFVFYVPAYIQDYNTILRGANDQLFDFSRQDYIKHIKHILEIYPHKVQLLLQRQDEFLDKEKLQFYLDLGIDKFCVGSIKQADILKNINDKFDITGSITMDITKDKIKENKKVYKQLFDNFVLGFKFNRDFNSVQEISKLPFNFILLVNSLCNVHCSGHIHWDQKNIINNGKLNQFCPNRLMNKILWKDRIIIRPMDLKLFDPYIKIYKLQDRGFQTPRIIRDYLLYNYDYSEFPNLSYDKSIYLK